MRHSYTATRSDELMMSRHAQKKLRARLDLAIAGLVVTTCLVVLFGDAFGYLVVLLASLLLGFLRYSLSSNALKKRLDESGIPYPHTQAIDVNTRRIRVETPHSWVEAHATALTELTLADGIATLHGAKAPLLNLPPVCATPPVTEAITTAIENAQPVEPITGGTYMSEYRPNPEIVEKVETFRAATGRGRTMPTSVLTLGYWIVIAGAAFSTATLRWELPMWTRVIAWGLAVLVVVTAGRRGDLMRRYEFWRNPPTSDTVRVRLDDEGITWQDADKTLFYDWSFVSQTEVYESVVVLTTPGGGLLFPTVDQANPKAIAAFATEQSSAHTPPPPKASTARRKALDPDNPFAAPDADDDLVAAWLPSKSNVIFWMVLVGLVFWITLNR
ncbi:MAG: hypothetical protein KC912_12795 [Proteobacteria bacterium]|nr:hypothetical protein [Pseudomonadota bacterium]